jgi:hypothetical protein
MSTLLKPRSFWIALGRIALFAIAVFLLWSILAYSLDASEAFRIRIESVGLIFGISCLGLRFLSGFHRNDPGTPGSRLPLWVWPLTIAAGVWLYWPALSVGLLSDDFTLTRDATAWRIGQLTPEFFRPVPLILWHLLLQLDGATGLHLLNIVLHAGNAILAGLVVSAWLPGGRWWGGLTVAMMLLNPLATEPVVWSSGIFDVLTASFLLCAVLAARRYQDPNSGATTRFMVGLLLLVALFTKESAVVGPFLVLVDGWIRRSLPRRLLRDIAATGAMMIGVSVLRLRVSAATDLRWLRKRRPQHVFFESIGSLAVPWHLDILQIFPLIRAASGLILIGLCLIFAFKEGTRERTRSLLGGFAWVLIALLPTLPLFRIGMDLQGARYLYLSEVGWIGLLLNLIPRATGPLKYLRSAAFSAIVLITVFNASAVRRQIHIWRDAAALRDLIVATAARNQVITQCHPAIIADLPDNWRGAYLFRVGAREFFQDSGVIMVPGTDRGPCSFQWNAATSSFSR